MTDFYEFDPERRLPPSRRDTVGLVVVLVVGALLVTGQALLAAWW